MIHIGTYKAWGQWMDPRHADMSNPDIRKIVEISTRRHYERNTGVKSVRECPFTLVQPLVILINEGTASSAEDMLVELDYLKRATLVGMPSYGSTGQPLSLVFPAAEVPEFVPAGVHIRTGGNLST